jgi:hypothetical protein
LTPGAKKFNLRVMKRLLSVILLLATGLALAGCDDTNDRGVIVDKPYDIFGAAATRVPASPPAPAANPAPAAPAANA